MAGGVEVSLLRQAVLTSRAQSLRSTFSEGRALYLAEQRLRLRRGRRALPEATAALDLARLLAQARVTAAVFSPQLRLLASAGPGTTAAAPVRTGVSVSPPSPADLLASARQDVEIGPTLVGSGQSEELVMLFPFTNRLGNSLGAVELAESAGPIQSELNAATWVVAAGGTAVLLVALLTGLLLTSRGLGPLRRLTAAAGALGRGDLSQRSGLTPRSDEVGVLARVFDEMADSVERTVRVREQAERQMRQFIADASHELRTPLTAIKGYLDVLQQGKGPSAEVVKAALPVMSIEAERMRTLVMDLLTLARADAGRSVELRPVDLSAFLEQFLAGRTATTAVKLELGSGLVALADPEAMATIAGNLQNNAERHGQGREIVWRTVQESGLVGLQCADLGPGIAVEDLPHVFERFFRAGGSRSRQDGGSGLGLAIVQSLAEAQGGRVTVQSQLGQGTWFTVLLRPTSASGWAPPPATL